MTTVLDLVHQVPTHIAPAGHQPSTISHSWGQISAAASPAVRGRRR